MTDIVERLRRKVFHGPTMEASHTKTVEWQAADEIEKLRAALEVWYSKYMSAQTEIDRLRAALRPFACKCGFKGEGAGGNCIKGTGECDCWIARAALEVK